MTKFHHSYFNTVPRTLESAFGPYQRYGLVEQHEPMPTADKIVVAIGIVALVALLVFIVFGWLPGGGS